MRRVSSAGLSGSLLTLGVAVLYVAILISERDDPAGQSVPWAVGFVTIGLAGLAASFVTNHRLRLLVFSLCAGTMLVVGVLSMFSIGALLLVAGLLFASAAWSARATASP